MNNPLNSISTNAIAQAKRMLAGLNGNSQICGDSKVVDGCWIETHTLGCRNAADEPREQWEHNHEQIRAEYKSEGINLVIDDEHSCSFVTITPLRKS